jgi:hypothetical protein
MEYQALMSASNPANARITLVIARFESALEHHHNTVSRSAF